MAQYVSQTLSYSDCKAAVAACVEAGVGVYVVGPPGCGKSSMMVEVARDLGRPLSTLIASNCDPVDFAGLPYVVDGSLRRALMPEIQAAVDTAAILFLDEIASVNDTVKAPLMRLILEQVAGATRLHAGAAIVAAGNYADQCPNGQELTAAQTNRFVVLELLPTIDEVVGYFRRLTGPLADEAADFAATLDMDPTLVQFTPARESIDAGKPFASPRAWERGLRAWTVAGARTDAVGYAILAGSVGDERAAKFLAYRRVRHTLPSVDEIIASPTAAKCPSADRRIEQISSLGILARVAARDVWAAWTYADRLERDIALAATRVIMVHPVKATASPHMMSGARAQAKLMGAASKAVG